MTNEEKYEYWLDIAQYDLETADAMFQSGRWLYVAYQCQQSLEKLVKGLYILYIDDKTPYIHDIWRIYSRFSDKLADTVEKEKYQNLFQKLTAYYLNTRYPSYKEKLSTSTTKEVAESILKESKEAFQWLLTLKPSTQN
jgi:HEPN domain-containing protein